MNGGPGTRRDGLSRDAALASGGEPREVESPRAKAEDIRIVTSEASATPGGARKFADGLRGPHDVV
jgi:hypothetical protein